MTEIQDRPTGTRRRRGRLGTVTLATLGLLLLGIGGVAATDAAADDGYVSLGARGTYQTPAYALTSDSTDWRHQLLGLTGTVRLRVAAPDGGAPLFVGVADPGTVHRYLAGVRYTTVHNHNRTEHDGGAPGSPVATRWTVSATGTGTQTLQWPAGAGEQVLVVLNADGSPSVRGRVESVQVTVRELGWIATGLLIAGAALLAAAVVRRRRNAVVGEER